MIPLESAMIDKITEPRFCQVLDAFAANIGLIEQEKQVSRNVKTARRRLNKAYRILLSVNPLNGSVNLSFVYQKRSITTVSCLAGGHHTVYSAPKDNGYGGYWTTMMGRSQFYAMMETDHPPFFEWLLWNQI